MAPVGERLAVDPCPVDGVVGGDLQGTDRPGLVAVVDDLDRRDHGIDERRDRSCGVAFGTGLDVGADAEGELGLDHTVHETAGGEHRAGRLTGVRQQLPEQRAVDAQRLLGDGARAGHLVTDPTPARRNEPGDDDVLDRIGVGERGGSQRRRQVGLDPVRGPHVEQLGCRRLDLVGSHRGPAYSSRPSAEPVGTLVAGCCARTLTNASRQFSTPPFK